MTTLSNCYSPLPNLPSTETPSLHRTFDSTPTSPTPPNQKRSPKTLRPIHLTTNILSQSKGSCLFEIGHSKILVGIMGPRSLPASTNPQAAAASAADNDAISDRGSISCHVQYAPHFGKGTLASTLPSGRSLVERFSDPLKIPNGTKEEELELSQQVTSALQSSVMVHTFPKCVVDIHIQIVQADGSLVSNMIVASSLALCEAGIECFDLVTSCTVAILRIPKPISSKAKEDYDYDYKCIVDPTEYEMMQSQGILTLAMLANARNDVTFWDGQGRLPHRILQEEALELAKFGCHTIHQFMRQCLIHSQEDDS